ncbi:hypothetical protein [Streptomyces hygroscopicus]|uniref:hypothetical protein n=1 Tax=Streptomyces hygroscopicus TaxID=1912 RepID=UPI001FCC870C|nr:hypothetical protein [Streptomyces hygroscopicus]BDH10522.1 hypothetical protein HOK021_17010 [Streptomyces hygroscopicus]
MSGKHTEPTHPRSKVSPTERKSLPYLLWFAARHPSKTLRRNHGKAVRSTGFGLGQWIGCCVYAGAIISWLTYQYVVHLL